ncbi:MAG: ABC transporter transmembrane domain-containing protein [Prosthecobacter sp.]
MRTILRVFSYLKRYPGMAMAQIGCAVGGTFLVLVLPTVTREIIDVIIPAKAWDRLTPSAMVVFGAFVLQNLFNSLRIRLNNSFEQKVIYDLRSDLYERLQRLPLRWFDNRPTGDIMTTVSEDIPAVERVLIDGIEQGLVAVLQIIIVAAFMFYADATLAWTAMLPMPLLALGAVLYTRSSRDRHRRVRVASSGMNSLLHDNVSGMRQIKAYAMEKEEHFRFNESSGALKNATLHLMHVWSIYRPTMALMKDLGTLIVLWFGARAIMHGNMKPGDLTAFLLLARLFYDPVEQLHSLNQMIQAGRAAGERVFGIMDAEEEHGIDDGLTLSNVKGHIRYANVGFSYTGKLPTVHGITIDAQPGQTIALVGPTGAGKSTLINLLTRFYEYDEGTLTIDDTQVKSISKASLRRHIGYVTQESFLFNGTVRDNLLIGKRDATVAELWSALESANAAEFVNRLPNQLDTHVGERGIKLSVGEKQRISIARALLRNPPILLLDEATASVDTETERQIQEALERLRPTRSAGSPRCRTIREEARPTPSRELFSPVRLASVPRQVSRSARTRPPSPLRSPSRLRRGICRAQPSTRVLLPRQRPAANRATSPTPAAVWCNRMSACRARSTCPRPAERRKRSRGGHSRISPAQLPTLRSDPMHRSLDFKPTLPPSPDCTSRHRPLTPIPQETGRVEP